MKNTCITSLGLGSSVLGFLLYIMRETHNRPLMTARATRLITVYGDVRVILIRLSILFSLLFPLIMVGSTQPNGSSNTIQKMDVKEALIRYIIDSGYDAINEADYLFLSFDEADPSNEFIEKFSQNRPYIFPSSLSVTDSDTGIVRHRSKGGVGTIVQIESTEIINRKKVRISWSYYKANLNSSGSIATLKSLLSR